MPAPSVGCGAGRGLGHGPAPQSYLYRGQWPPRPWEGPQAPVREGGCREVGSPHSARSKVGRGAVAMETQSLSSWNS